MVTSLAWTENGGEIMPVEVAVLDGKGGLQMTGQMGEVMQESGQAALTYIKVARRRAWGSIWKYSSAWTSTSTCRKAPFPRMAHRQALRMATAIVSALTGRPVFKQVGMTGEITLRGRILPIGGVREKVLAAHRAGLKTVILPEKNMKDLVDVPKTARAS